MINSSRCDFSAYKVRKLQEGETIKSFDCGDEDLNDFIMNRVDDYLKTMLAVTYVFEHKATGKIIGYFSYYSTKSVKQYIMRFGISKHHRR